jgi:hypothetical protein
MFVCTKVSSENTVQICVHVPCSKVPGTYSEYSQNHEHSETTIPSHGIDRTEQSFSSVQSIPQRLHYSRLHYSHDIWFQTMTKRLALLPQFIKKGKRFVLCFLCVVLYEFDTLIVFIFSGYSNFTTIARSVFLCHAQDRHCHRLVSIFEEERMHNVVQ